jgi:ABC-type multidrug transport system ATPase subunit
MGYCPQFNALPGALTAREVLWLYARLRGVPARYIPGVVAALLDRIDLTQYADRCANSNVLSVVCHCSE